MAIKIDINNENFYIGSTAISMKQFLQEFNKQYTRLYNNGSIGVLRNEAELKLIDEGNEFIRDNSKFMFCFYNVRQDYITSDREVAALVLAMEETKKKVKAENQKESKSDNIFAVAVREVYGKPSAIALKIPRNANLVGYIQDCKTFNIFSTWKEAQKVAEEWNRK